MSKQKLKFPAERHQQPSCREQQQGAGFGHDRRVTLHTVAGRDCPVVRDIAPNRAVTTNGPLLDVDGSASQRQNIVHDHRAIARLRQRMTHQIQRIVKCQRRIAGDVDVRVIEQINSNLELMRALSTHGRVIRRRRRGCRHVDTAEASDHQAVHSVSELDTVHRHRLHDGNECGTGDARSVFKDRLIIGIIGGSVEIRVPIRSVCPIAQTGQVPRKAGRRRGRRTRRPKYLYLIETDAAVEA